MTLIHDVDLAPVEYATLLGLLGLAISVMQNDEKQGREYIRLLSHPSIEKAVAGVVEKMMSDKAREAMTNLLQEVDA